MDVLQNSKKKVGRIFVEYLEYLEYSSHDFYNNKLIN